MPPCWSPDSIGIVYNQAIFIVGPIEVGHWAPASTAVDFLSAQPFCDPSKSTDQKRIRETCCVVKDHDMDTKLKFRVGRARVSPDYLYPSSTWMEVKCVWTEISSIIL